MNCHPSETTAPIQSSNRLAVLVFAAALATTVAGGQAPAALAPLQPAISDVQWLTGEPTGTRIVQFKLDGPKGMKFFVWWTNTGLRGAASTGPVWEKASDDTAHVKVTIEYTLNFKGDRTQDVLTSGEDVLQLRLEPIGGPKEGLPGIASAPLLPL